MDFFSVLCVKKENEKKLRLFQTFQFFSGSPVEEYVAHGMISRQKEARKRFCAG